MATHVLTIVPAILEQILNTTLIEPEAHEKERLLDLSKEELIEQVLKANVSQASQTLRIFSFFFPFPSLT